MCDTPMVAWSITPALPTLYGNAITATICIGSTNNGGPALGNRQDNATFSYHYRNPVWLCGGQEKETDQGRTIVFSQPEIIIYDDDPLIRMSYPDLIETDSDFYITETQKDVARIHHLDKNLLQGLWNQDKTNSVQTDQINLSVSTGK